MYLRDVKQENMTKSLAIAAVWVMAIGNAWGQPGPAPELKQIDGIIGVVGNEILLESEIATAVFSAKAQGVATDEAARCKMMEDLLFQKLLVHNARLDSIEVGDMEVMDEIERRLAYYIRMFGTVEAFEAEYGQTISEWKAEFQAPVQEQLMAQKMQAEINQQVRATPAEVQTYFAETHPDSLPLIPEALSYSEIVLQPTVTEGAKMATRTQLDSIRILVSTGKMSMTLAASRYSEDPGSKYKGGCYENISRGAFVPEFEAAVFDTPVGDLSPVFETDFGFHFLRVTEHRGELFSACHVLMAPKINASDLQEMGVIIDSLAGALSTDATTFDALVLSHSTSEATRNQGGKVVNDRDGSRRFGADELDANVYMLLNALTPGEVSPPVQLTNGDGLGYWTILRLDGRHEAHRANPTEDFSLFQSQVEANLRKSELNEWIGDHIEEAYIRIDPPYQECVTEFPWTASPK
jgi:peptidyl-prolyl cis-trans isomerase SurA